MLQKWYNSDEKKSRILKEWQTMKLTESMLQNREESEVEVIRRFVARLMNLQKQLDTSFHGDRYFRYRLLNAVDIANIQEALRDKMPGSSQLEVNRIENRLWNKSSSAGSVAVHYTAEVGSVIEENE